MWRDTNLILASRNAIALYECLLQGCHTVYDIVRKNTLRTVHTCAGTTFDGAEAAADHLSHAIALEPRFWPALVEKARLWATIGDWDQVRMHGSIWEALGAFHPSIRKRALTIVWCKASCVITDDENTRTVEPTTKSGCLFVWFQRLCLASCQVPNSHR